MMDRLVRVAQRPRPALLLIRRARYQLENWVSPTAATRERVASYTRNLRMRFNLQDDIEREVYFTGSWEPLTCAVLRGLTEEGMTVADVGAHVGSISLIAARLVGQTGIVLAFEPNPANRARLSANVKLNGLRNLRLYPVALSDHVGSEQLDVPEGNSGWGAILREDAARRATVSGFSVEVETRTLDGIIAELPGVTIDVMKIDAEGHEAAVLRGALGLIARDRPAVILEVNDIVETAAGIASETAALLRAAGYQLYAISPGGRRGYKLRALDPREDPRSSQQPWTALNLVALPTEAGPTPMLAR